PQCNGPRDLRVSRQPVEFGAIGLFQNIQNVSAANAGRIVYAGFSVTIRPEGSRAILRLTKQILARAETEAIRGTSFNACRFDSDGNTITAKRALVDFLCRRVQPRNIKRTTRHTVAAADARIRIEVDDAAGVLDDCSGSGTGFETAGVDAMHTLVLR